MARDGTNRGGARIGAGRPRKKENQEFQVPAFKAYLATKQKNGSETCAAEVYRETFAWLEKCGCAEMVSPQIVESFAQLIARHVQAEETISQMGFFMKHPTTGEPMTNPIVRVSLDYFKAAQQVYWQIQQAVNIHADDDACDIMEFLTPLGDEDDDSDEDPAD